MENTATAPAVSLPNFEKLNTEKWVYLSFKVPAVFRFVDAQYIIRTIRNIKGNIMCELEMDDDKLFRNINLLPVQVQQQLDHHLGLQLQPSK